jgi:hypothetical protein
LIVPSMAHGQHGRHTLERRYRDPSFAGTLS